MTLNSSRHNKFLKKFSFASLIASGLFYSSLTAALEPERALDFLETLLREEPITKGGFSAAGCNMPGIGEIANFMFNDQPLVFIFTPAKNCDLEGTVNIRSRLKKFPYDLKIYNHSDFNGVRGNIQLSVQPNDRKDVMTSGLNFLTTDTELVAKDSITTVEVNYLIGFDFLKKKMSDSCGRSWIRMHKGIEAEGNRSLCIVKKDKKAPEQKQETGISFGSPRPKK